MSSSMGHPVNLQRSTLYVSSSEHKWLFPKRFHHLHRRLCSVTPISPSSLLTWELYPFAFNLTISICHVSGSVFFTTFVTMYHHLTLLDRVQEPFLPCSLLGPCSLTLRFPRDDSQQTVYRCEQNDIVLQDGWQADSKEACFRALTLRV